MQNIVRDAQRVREMVGNRPELCGVLAFALLFALLFLLTMSGVFFAAATPAWLSMRFVEALFYGLFVGGALCYAACRRLGGLDPTGRRVLSFAGSLALFAGLITLLLVFTKGEPERMPGYAAWGAAGAGLGMCLMRWVLHLSSLGYERAVSVVLRGLMGACVLYVGFGILPASAAQMTCLLDAYALIALELLLTGRDLDFGSKAGPFPPRMTLGGTNIKVAARLLQAGSLIGFVFIVVMHSQSLRIGADYDVATTGSISYLGCAFAAVLLALLVLAYLLLERRIPVYPGLGVALVVLILIFFFLSDMVNNHVLVCLALPLFFLLGAGGFLLEPLCGNASNGVGGAHDVATLRPAMWGYALCAAGVVLQRAHGWMLANIPSTRFILSTGIILTLLIVVLLSFGWFVVLGLTHSERRETPAKSPGGPFAIEHFDQYAASIGLTNREQEIAELLLQGRSLRFIEERFSISPSTVKTHCGHIYEKAGVANKQELIQKIRSM